MATDFKNQPSFSPRRRWKIALDMIVRTILVLAVIVMVNYLGSRFFSRFYLSSRTQELSARTLGILHSLTNHVVVTIYYDKDEELYPTIVALLNEYRTANPKISVQAVDYVRDSGEAEKVKVASDKFLGLAKDMDTLLGTRREFLLGSWLESATT